MCFNISPPNIERKTVKIPRDHSKVPSTSDRASSAENNHQSVTPLLIGSDSPGTPPIRLVYREPGPQSSASQRPGRRHQVGTPRVAAAIPSYPHRAPTSSLPTSTYGYPGERLPQVPYHFNDCHGNLVRHPDHREVPSSPTCQNCGCLVGPRAYVSVPRVCSSCVARLRLPNGNAMLLRPVA